MTEQLHTDEPAPAAAPPQRRPKNRKAQIAATAAEAFSERGYHATGIDDIAARLGISGPALYRHFPNKYALFLHATTSLADALITATDEAERDTSLDPESQLRQALTELIRTTIDNRMTGGLYRWEGRYLKPEDRARLREKIDLVNQRIIDPLSALRPGLPEPDAVMLSAAALSVIGSITAHRAALPVKRIESLLLAVCWSVLQCELPAMCEASSSEAEDSAHSGMAMTSKREVLLHESVSLFHQRGYHEVSIEEIGAAAGMNASGVYRHFTSKSELLAAAFHRASDRMTVAVTSALAESETPETALARLVEVYVDLSFKQSELMSVYFAEIGNLPKDQRTSLRNIQRLNVEEWAHLLGEVRSDLAPAEARFLVHAAFGLVVDIGRLVRFSMNPGAQRRVQRLMLATLLGRQH
ncbi:MAG: TetR/AcrR family transcriptional regulator [Mycobacteriaceae bacterium]